MEGLLRKLGWVLVGALFSGSLIHWLNRPGNIPVSRIGRAAHCQPTVPLTCGQVRVAGASFFDQHGLWVMHGVQFFLPTLGINGRSLWDAEYQLAHSDGSLAYWLDRASGYLHANTLRIFVDMPYEHQGQTITPTSHHTLLDLANQANARGMRLGISLHNNDDWQMTPARQAWIEELLSFFLQHDALALIVYLNLDNELNNHCDPQHTLDCFAHMNHDYIDAAIDWVRQGTHIIKARAPQMLVTVGMSTELAAPAEAGGLYNYFVADHRGETISSLIDFLAPHNYAGRGAEIIAAIRHQHYTHPVVLEEYGFPTDPFPENAAWTEGNPVCRRDPLQAVCFETAPFYVEVNLNALRHTGYAGGVAWMLADMREKDSPTACAERGLPFDLWTGLFAVSGQYCDGGTYTRSVGTPKATAVRICAYHTNNLEWCLRNSNGSSER